MGSSAENDSAGPAESPRHTRLLRLAEEQSALRRIATLVASGASAEDVFTAVAREVAEVMRLPMVGVCRFDSDGFTTVVATCSDRPHVMHAGTRWPLDGPSMVAQVHKTGRPARIEDYTGLPGALAAGARTSGLGATAGAPIIVDGSVWGAMAACSPDAPLPDQIEDRLAEFTDLLAAAIANSERREQLARLVDEQSALRRVATLVAKGAPPTDVFEAVIAEVGRLVPTDAAGLSRYEADGTVTVIGGWSRSGGYRPIGTRHPVGTGTLIEQILETGRPGRLDSYENSSGSLADVGRELGWRSAVGAPLIAEGRLWGVLGVGSTTDQPLPVATERRLTEFAALAATAVANAESRAELNASRARIVATADATRRRIERDLHDGTQQRVVSIALELRAAEQAVPAELHEHRAALARAVEGLTSVLNELREIARGIHPAILAEGGLVPALKTLARRSAVPVELELPSELQLPEAIEVAAYYIVSEAITNAAKYAHAPMVHVAVEVHEDLLRVSVRDDGRGGADPDGGSGLVGLKDRAEAMGGTMSLQSPLGSGTSLQVDLPLDISRQSPYLRFANKDALFRAAVRHELDTALGEVSRSLKEEGVGLEQRVVAALDAWLGRYVGSMPAPDIGNLLQNPTMHVGEMVDPAIAAFDTQLAAAIAAAMSEQDRRRLGVIPEEIAGALHMATQGAKYVSNARGESREEFVARMAAAVRVVLAGFVPTVERTR